MSSFLGKAIPIIIIGAVIFWLFGPQIVHGVTVVSIYGSAAILLIVAIVVAVLVAMSTNGPARGAAVLATVGLVGFGLFTAVTFDYEVRSVYAGEVQVVQKSAPDYADRAPFDVARESSKRNLGDTTGEANNVKVLPDEGDHGLWTALVNRRGFLAGYEATQSIDVPLFGAAGASVTETCAFNVNAAGHRMDAVLPHQSLDYLVFGATPPNVTYDYGDAYSYCDDKGVPQVVMPLKQVSGFWIPSWTNYGAAVYDGNTGQLTVHTDTSDIPGPVYPQSLAIAQRESLDAIDSFEDKFFNRAGYESTAGDKGDPNAGNESEITLRVAGSDDAGYVTPLTPRGDSNSVVAMFTTDASSSTAGARNLVTVFEYKKGATRAANSSVAAALKSTYSWMPDWASGMKIFEIVPGTYGSWVASIGQSQSVVYRAVINADGDAVLHDKSGAEVTRTNQNPDGDEPLPAEPTPAAPAADSDLSELTPQQLQELANAVIKELAGRTN